MTRSESIKKARAIRTRRVKDKIQNAVNILRLYGKKTTVRAVAEEASVSTTTVQKYLGGKES